MAKEVRVRDQGRYVEVRYGADRIAVYALFMCVLKWAF
jgi:hypothetical protein